MMLEPRVDWLCQDATSLWDIQNPCVRSIYGASTSGLLVLLFLLFAIPPFNRIPPPLRTFLTVDEAENILAQNPPTDTTDTTNLIEPRKPLNNDNRAGPPPIAPLWKSALPLSALALAETLAWLAWGSYNLYLIETGSRPRLDAAAAVVPFVFAFVWGYGTIRTLVRPTVTPPYDLFVLYVVVFAAASLDVSVSVYQRFVEEGPWGRLEWVYVANWGVVGALLLVLLAMPLGIPSARVEQIVKNGTYVSWEDYTTLWGWISFNWVSDLIERGTKTELEEDDVPDLSPSLQSKAVYERFTETKRKSLLRQIFAANALDIFLDSSLTFVSVVLNYAAPFFLKLILDEIQLNPEPSLRHRAYIYAVLMFLATMAKVEADVQHLWFGRRASVRVRSELMAAIYVKALRRKDFSGIVKKGEEPKDAKTKKATEESDGSSNKTGADTGKIVQLMAADANRIANMVTGAYFIYSSPMEIIVASIMLYSLLGWHAFAGFSVLVIATPVNHLLSKRGVTIGRGLSAARDKRMTVLNELIGGIKFIKFFAWEPQWLKRAQEARNYELSWLVKDRINSLLFSFLWSLAPTFVSIVSFFSYVYFGNELTIATAFTAIALFNMLKLPLNVIPMFIVMLLQAGVSLDRIAVFLGEEEVPDYVSSFKRPVKTGFPTPEDLEIGITGHVSFAWNEVKEPPPKKEKKTKGKKKSREPPAPQDPVTTNLPEERFELRDLDVLFPVGKLSLVVGPTASGKSALLMALLGEMTLLDPTTETTSIHLPKEPFQLDLETGLSNSVSYCAQTPWLEHATIKQNILFYAQYEEERYNAVIQACALQPDLDILEDGDETEIGARGVSLSGGQKARVALARAVYARTLHVILDDPLAAVDSQTARHLYENVLLGPLMRGRTCILVTHHVDLVRPGAHFLVRMLDGRIDTQGVISELDERGVLDAIVQDEEAEERAEKVPLIKVASEDDVDTIAEDAAEKQAIEEEDGERGEEEADGPAHGRTDTDATLVAGKKSKKARKLVKDEARAKGNVKWNIYKTYLAAAGWFTWIWLSLFICLYQVSGVIEKLWIKTWGEHYENQLNSILASFSFSSYGIDQSHHSVHDILSTSSWQNWSGRTSNATMATATLPELPSAQDHPMFYIAVYAGIGLAGTLITVSNSIVQYVGSYRASKVLFTRLLDVVIRSPMRFFDTTPTGRILNRFSKDFETVDSSLSSSLRSTSSWLASFIACVVTVVVFLPQFSIPACFIAWGYYRLSYGYIVAGRSLRRMESTTRSPIFAAFGDTLEGLVTVRAFSKEKPFVDRTHAKIDLTTKMWYGFWMLNRWLLLRFDSVGAVSTFITSVFALARLDTGLAGLTITSAMAFTQAVYWTCRMITQLEMDLNSVERVVEYLDLPQEPPAIVESNRVPAYWPSTSSDQLVVVEDLVIRYAPELPPVLHGVSFSLKPRERVGLLGRTGSGKSTLAMALLRFVDPSSGRIIIDGVDISSIGLQDLRSRLTIIPQDAVLFSGTIRDNLDPFGEHSDMDCLDALERVHINNSSAPASRRPSRPPSVHGEGADDHASSSGETSQTGTTQYDDQKHTITLESKVSAGGANFSQGQRQLIALARALLRRSSIIIMDEATSSIDFKTDSLVQSTIRDEFSNSLLITIAHRIRTIIDYDRLIVLDQGQIAEFGTPLELIQKESGVFRGMCLKSGHFDDLLSAARSA